MFVNKIRSDCKQNISCKKEIFKNLFFLDLLGLTVYSWIEIQEIKQELAENMNKLCLVQ